MGSSSYPRTVSRPIQNSHFQPQNARNLPNLCPTVHESPHHHFPNPNSQPISSLQQATHPLSLQGVASDFRDPASLQILKQSLLSPGSNVFSGDPLHYHSWLTALENRTANISLSTWDKLLILEANTSGEPQRLVRKYLAIGGPNIDNTLQCVMEDLRSDFGCGIRIANALHNRIDSFQPIRSTQDTSKLKDLLSMCQFIEMNMDRSEELSSFNTAFGLRKLWLKLPDPLQCAWRTISDDYRQNFNRYPPLSNFIGFLKKKTRELSDPLFQTTRETRRPSTALKTSQFRQPLTQPRAQPFTLREKTHNEGQRNLIGKAKAGTVKDSCPLHKDGKHQLEECRKFANLSNKEKSSVIRDNKRCFSCLGHHFKAECTSNIRCQKCSGAHHTILHYDKPAGEPSLLKSESNLCTAVCRNPSLAKSCSKVLLVDISVKGSAHRKLRCYAVIDEQSTSTFADPKVAEYFNLSGPKSNYELRTLSGSSTPTSGIILRNLRIKGVGERKSYPLPDTYTNPFLPDCRSEVASRETVQAHPHIRQFADKFNQLDHRAEVLLLVGRDAGPCMFTRCYGGKAPFVHHTALGWALVGRACVISDCERNPRVLRTAVVESFSQHPVLRPIQKAASTEFDVLLEQQDDEHPGLSKEDEQFLQLVTSDVRVNEQGNIVLPLPFRDRNQIFPNNRLEVFHRTKNALGRLKSNAAKLKECIETMEKYRKLGHVEMLPAPEHKPPHPGKAWWIPVFPVTHPKKKTTRIVFDSSARYHGISLNDALLPGPDIINRLKNVLIGFRIGLIGFAADIQTMFHNFHLNANERDFLRFYWFRDNNPSLEICQFRAKVHIFGNCSSPALANIGLRYAAQNSNLEHVRDFINDQFYVDDGLSSADTVTEATSILEDTRQTLDKFNIRLHKICSSSQEVERFFPSTELASSSKKNIEDTTVQGALGITWDIKEDKLEIRSEIYNHPFTKRGLLATINSIFDPLGICSPVVLAGKILQRKLLTVASPKNSSDDWDTPLSEEYKVAWDDWKVSLKKLNRLSLTRCYRPPNFGKVTETEIHAFCDASEEGYGYVIYLRFFNNRGETHISFVSASSKIVPKSAPSVPRLELSSAVELSLAVPIIAEKLSVTPSKVYLYSDSMITLGYLRNQCKRFSRYVTRRVRIILKSYSADRWFHVSSFENPADKASRPQTIESLLSSEWFKGPCFLNLGTYPQSFIDSVELPEVIKEPLVSLKTESSSSQPFSSLIERCGTLSKLVRCMQVVISFVAKLRNALQARKGQPPVPSSRPSSEEALTTLILHEQRVHFPEFFLSSHSGKLLPLSPFIDSSGVVRVGGRLRQSELEYQHKYPILLPPLSHLTRLLIAQSHGKSKHQGRHITLSTIRNAGYFILHGSSVIRKFISQCVTCKKLRLPLADQKMSDLPTDRLKCVPPFTTTGVDIFGPYSVSDGVATRRTQTHKKCWAVVFTCLTSRATHIEPLPSLETPSMKNALRRFFCLRGPCKRLRSDPGTSFVGVINSQDDLMSDAAPELQENNCTWDLNPPKASHFGGVWERQIKTIKGILQTCFHQLGPKTLSRDDLYTFLQECACILNNTPLWEYSADPNDPKPLSPAMLLTLREDTPTPPGEFSERDLLAYGSRRWRRIQYLSDQFWTRWRTDYLQTLQKRRKWLQPQRSFRVGDVVLLKDANLKRYLWPIAKIISVKTSNDGLVRSVELVTTAKNSPGTRTLHRPITDLSLLVPSPL